MQGIVENGEYHVLRVRWRLCALILQRQCMRTAYDWGVNHACLRELCCCFPISKIITLKFYVGAFEGIFLCIPLFVLTLYGMFGW